MLSLSLKNLIWSLVFLDGVIISLALDVKGKTSCWHRIFEKNDPATFFDPSDYCGTVSAVVYCLLWQSFVSAISDTRFKDIAAIDFHFVQ